MTCFSSIADCLKQNGINPIPSSFNSDPYKALVYDDNYFDLYNSNPLNQWWKIDFTRVISLSKYQIQSGDWCHYLKKWDAYVSKDNKNWTKVDSQTGFAAGRVFPIKPVNARYFKIIGNDGDCGGNCLFFKWIKFFGSLRPGSQYTYSQNKLLYLCLMKYIFLMVIS